MQASLAFVTAFYVANAHGPQPVLPQPIDNQPFGCPQSPITPEVGSYCSQPGRLCNYPSMGQSFQCGRDNSWLDQSSSQSCYKDGHTYKDGYKFVNSQGCTEWQCMHGTISYNQCPSPPHGCYKDGVTYPNHYQPPPNAAGCVEWQCENGKIRYNPCPVKPVDSGCWRNDFYYHDGFVKYTTDGRHCALWQCSNGHIEYLGNCPQKRQCYYKGAQYPDGYTYHGPDGCPDWKCQDGHLEWLYGCNPPLAECEHNGHKVSVGTRIRNYKGPHFNCATAECTKNNGKAKFQCILY